MTLLPLITTAASLAGDGEMIYAVFTKNGRSERNLHEEPQSAAGLSIQT